MAKSRLTRIEEQAGRWSSAPDFCQLACRLLAVVPQDRRRDLMTAMR